MWTLYHLAWLGYDLAHLGRPWAWFFLAIGAFALIRMARPRRPWRRAPKSRKE